jgi:hypothetical protein
MAWTDNIPLSRDKPPPNQSILKTLPGMKIALPTIPLPSPGPTPPMPKPSITSLTPIGPAAGPTAAVSQPAAAPVAETHGGMTRTAIVAGAVLAGAGLIVWAIRRRY